MAIGPGMKDDGSKLPWGLLMGGMGLALHAVVQVLAFGARKYAANSWQAVDNGYERYKDALYRHLFALERGGILARDPETGLLELAHIACNALFLCWFAVMEGQKVHVDKPVEQLHAEALQNLARINAVRPAMAQLYASAIANERAEEMLKFPSHGLKGNGP